MRSQRPSRNPFKVLTRENARRKRGMFRPLAHVAEFALGLRRLAILHDRVGDTTSTAEYVARCLEVLGIECHVPEGDLQRIPATGPAIVTANHPYGALEGLLIAHLLFRVRPDVKILANHELDRFDRLADLLIPLDSDATGRARQRNRRPLLQALRWVGAGGVLVVFPAGEVAHRRWGQRGVHDPEWHPTVGRIVRRTGAPAVPIYIDGRNGRLFQFAGLVHPALRSILQPRALLQRMGRIVQVRIGKAISAEGCARFTDDRELTDYLRLRTLILGRRLAGEWQPRGAQKLVRLLKPKPPLAPLATATAPDRLERDILRLPAEQLLVEASGHQVWLAHAPQIPNVLTEIGRLREMTFRLVGEGTGRSLDLDRHDRDYLHLFVWHPVDRDIVGAYRLGPTDRLFEKGGLPALYTSTLFDLDRRFVQHVTPGLELGRSFVQAKYQRSYMPLLLLWRGIGTFVARNPQYARLFGPVSISADYQRASRELMVEHLMEHVSDTEFSSRVRPRHPVRTGSARRLGLKWTPTMLADLGDVSAMVAEIEADARGVPVLIREYLKLGGRILGFNVDPAFRDVVDGLVLVDLTRTEPRILARYMGKEAAEGFLTWHRERGGLATTE